MAWTPNSFPLRPRAVSTLTGSTTGGAPFVLHGYYTVSATAREGDTLIRSAGALTIAADNPAANTIIGVTASVAPRFRDSSQTPRQRATNSTIADRTKYDDDKSLIFYPWVNGNLFQAHLVTDLNTDETADSNLDIYIATISPCFQTPNWTVMFGGVANAVSLGFVNPQMTTIVAGALSTNPGPIKNDVGGATGTINPLIIYMPKAGLLGAVS